VISIINEEKVKKVIEKYDDGDNITWVLY